MTDERLPDELLWDEGHASDLALSALADGEEAPLSAEVVRHAATCDQCAMRLGAAAITARGVTHALSSLEPPLPKAAPAAARLAVPWPAVFAALGLTLLGLAPRLFELPHSLATFATKLSHAAPVVAHSAAQVFHAGLGGQWTILAGACAALLIAGGLAVARLLPAQTVT